MTLDLQDSKIAEILQAGTTIPAGHRKVEFFMSTKLMNAAESLICTNGEKKVFEYLKHSISSYDKSWVGSVTGADLSEHFVGTRKKTSAQHYSRILAELKKNKLIFTVRINLNRTLGVHLNMVWVCLDCSQWECIYKGCHVYPSTVARFIASKKLLIYTFWDELRKLNIKCPGSISGNGFVLTSMANAIAEQFVPRMSPEIKALMPRYMPGDNPETYMDAVVEISSRFKDQHGIDSAKPKFGDSLKKSAIEFGLDNGYETLVEDHILDVDKQEFSVVQSSTPEAVSVVQDSTPEMFSSVQSSTPEAFETSSVSASFNESSNAPSRACARDMDKEIKRGKEKQGVLGSDKKHSRVETKKGIDNSESRKAPRQMNSPDNVVLHPSEGSLKTVKKTSSRTHKPKNSFDEAAPRIYDIKTTTGIFVALKDAMFKKHPGFKFNGGWEYNTRSQDVSNKLEKIREDGYLDEEILTDWVSWYANVYMTPEKIMKSESKFIASFVKTWDQYKKTVSRPEEREARRREIKSHKISGSVNSITSTETHLDRIVKKSKKDEEAIKTMLLQFGIVVTGNYMASIRSDDVSNLVGVVLSSMSKMETQHVYGMTTMRESHRILTGGVPFSDWRDIYAKQLASAVGFDLEPIDYECEEVDKFLSNIVK